VAAERSYAFRLALTPRAEVDVVAAHVMANLGAARFAILYPRDAYGRGLKDLFWDAVESRGGRVVGVGRYEPDATDFREPIRRLVGYLLLDDEQKAALLERKKLQSRAKRVGPEEAALLREEAAALTGPDEEPLPPIVDFDALFIADAHEKVALIAPQLAFHEVSGVQLLGPSGWNHPDLLSVGGRHLEGAIFAESFFGNSRFAFVREFSERYVVTFGEAPDVLAAQAFDATNLVLVQLARGLTTRAEVREGLLGVRGHPGVSGITSIQPDGNAVKRPFLLSVREGEIVSLD
jgi:ABC-type branched-subunit amino acid transport system substrate-binding protein